MIVIAQGEFRVTKLLTEIEMSEERSCRRCMGSDILQDSVS